MSVDNLSADEISLLPCPFCGSEAHFEQIQMDHGTDDFRWSVGCEWNDERGEKELEQCIGLQSLQTYARKKDAAEAWNKRYCYGCIETRVGLNPEAINHE